MVMKLHALTPRGNWACYYDFGQSLLVAKRSFYRTFNAVFGKVANAALESVVIELLKTKCLPRLYHGLEACPIGNVGELQTATNSYCIAWFPCDSTAFLFQVPCASLQVDPLDRFRNLKNYICSPFPPKN